MTVQEGELIEIHVGCVFVEILLGMLFDVSGPATGASLPTRQNSNGFYGSTKVDRRRLGPSLLGGIKDTSQHITTVSTLPYLTFPVIRLKNIPALTGNNS